MNKHIVLILVLLALAMCSLQQAVPPADQAPVQQAPTANTLQTAPQTVQPVVAPTVLPTISLKKSKKTIGIPIIQPVQTLDGANVEWNPFRAVFGSSSARLIAQGGSGKNKISGSVYVLSGENVEWNPFRAIFGKSSARQVAQGGSGHSSGTVYALANKAHTNYAYVLGGENVAWNPFRAIFGKSSARQVAQGGSGRSSGTAYALARIGRSGRIQPVNSLSRRRRSRSYARGLIWVPFGNLFKRSHQL
jgi:hypothetical protein